MDLALTSSQEMLKQSARDFLAKECPKSLVRELREAAVGHSPALWQRMAELGWMGLMVPADNDGTGANFSDLVVLLEEMGRALLPSPFVSTTLCAMAIGEAGSAEQKKSLLPKIASGDLIASFALTEPTATFSADGVKATATENGGGYLINGTKLFVRDANVADCIVCVARTGGASPEEGITLFLVDPKTAGVSITPLKTIGRDRQCEIVLANVRVAKDSVLGPVGQGWPLVAKMVQWGALAECAEMVGAGQQVLEWVVDYAKQRVQFGRPIGSFQAIQHKCANMLADVDGSRFMTYYAAWKLSEGMPATADVSQTKAWVSDAFRRITREGHQIFGGLGFTVDHDMHLYSAKEKVAEMAYGDADFHRKIVARELLD
ncbi:MAG: acyl-CoA/acyl-ACP dehydrogenase [Chloroflexi bacterium]|nr:acyl-CoA/acyl-ACP dehydrogenase [Chloroflexota bacterium]